MTLLIPGLNNMENDNGIKPEDKPQPHNILDAWKLAGFDCKDIEAFDAKRLLIRSIISDMDSWEARDLLNVICQEITTFETKVRCRLTGNNHGVRLGKWGRGVQ